MRIADPHAAPDLPVETTAAVDGADDAAPLRLDGRAGAPLDRIAIGPRAAARLAARSTPPLFVTAAPSDEDRIVAVGARRLNLSEGLYSLE